MKPIIAICAVALLSSCSTSAPPASDLSGAGFVMTTPNAASRQHMIVNDREFAEQTAVNRAACQRAPLCKK
jgi:hypothetical protein